MAVGLEERVAQLRAAGDETRIRLLALLAKGERTVKELTDILGQSQPRVSRHLKVLAEARLVSRTPEGSWVYYRSAGRRAAASRLPSPSSTGSRRMTRSFAATAIVSTLCGRPTGRLRNAISPSMPASGIEFARCTSRRRMSRSAILAAAGQGPFRAMLDIGTGTGRMLELFADRCERALGIDLSQAMLAVARANLERAGISHARVRVGECTNLPVVRESFDLVVIHQVLHFLDDPAAALAEAAARSRRAGGWSSSTSRRTTTSSSARRRPIAVSASRMVRFCNGSMPRGCVPTRRGRVIRALQRRRPDRHAVDRRG